MRKILHPFSGLKRHANSPPAEEAKDQPHPVLTARATRFPLFFLGGGGAGRRWTGRHVYLLAFFSIKSYFFQNYAQQPYIASRIYSRDNHITPLLWSAGDGFRWRPAELHNVRALVVFHLQAPILYHMGIKSP